ncbi:hypothetical protein OG203_17920 [Nocardia sp. NBC_01499]|uniref:hypothetical protein n=1 Tax=Nocardia sp. NBC_01499 TaxID=2903597 RepID=UPI00387029A8
MPTYTCERIDLVGKVDKKFGNVSALVGKKCQSTDAPAVTSEFVDVGKADITGKVSGKVQTYRCGRSYNNNMPDSAQGKECKLQK